MLKSGSSSDVTPYRDENTIFDDVSRILNRFYMVLQARMAVNDQCFCKCYILVALSIYWFDYKSFHLYRKVVISRFSSVYKRIINYFIYILIIYCCLSYILAECSAFCTVVRCGLLHASDHHHVRSCCNTRICDFATFTLFLNKLNAMFICMGLFHVYTAHKRFKYAHFSFIIAKICSAPQYAGCIDSKPSAIPTQTGYSSECYSRTIAIF